MTPPEPTTHTGCSCATRGHQNKKSNKSYSLLHVLTMHQTQQGQAHSYPAEVCVLPYSLAIPPTLSKKERQGSSKRLGREKASP